MVFLGERAKGELVFLKVPKMHWDIGINATQYQYDMTFGGLDRSLRDILLVVTGWYQLVRHLLILDGLLELLGALIIK